MASSSDTDQRKKAARLLGKKLGRLEDKDAAWRDLHMLTGDQDSSVREGAAHALESAFSQITKKDAAWRDLIGLAGDQDIDVQWSAAIALGAAFQYVLNKDAAWKDLIMFISTMSNGLLEDTAYALGAAFQYVTDKEAAWKDLHELAADKNSNVRWCASIALSEAFNHFPDKDAALKDLTKLTGDLDSGVREETAYALGAAFQYVTNKEAAWRDLIRLTRDHDSSVRSAATSVLGSAFQYLSDKEAAENELHRLTRDEDREVRRSAATAIGWSLQYISDKEASENDLHRLTRDEDSGVRSWSAHAIEIAFQYIADRKTAWKDLHRLAGDQDSEVRRRAAYALGSAFQDIIDKVAAENDILRLTRDKDSIVREASASAIGAAIQYVPDKEVVESDLHILTRDEYSHVRRWSAKALGAAFQYVRDRVAASKDLHRLSGDQDRLVRWGVAEVLGAAFQYVTDKEAAWKDLIRLTKDSDSIVGCTAYHSMGRISILKAIEADDELEIHLEEAIEFFRESSEKAEYINPAAFCLPFYRSLHSLLFTDVSQEDEVQKYLAEAREAIEDSERRETLLEAVNNLSKALQEVRTYSIDDIMLRKRDLKSYTKYCLQAAECLREARSKAPLASKVVDYTLVEKSIPVLDQKIKALFKDVEATAGELCKSTKGTDLEAFGRDAYESTRGLNKVESWIAADRYLEEIVPLLKGHCNRLPREAQAYLKTLVNSQDSASLEQRFDTLKSVLLASLVQGENDDRLVKELKELLDLHLQNIEFAILNLNTSSGNARKDLYNLKNQIDRLQKEIESQGLAKKELAEALDEKDQAMIDRLEKMREKMLRAVRETTQLNASKRDVETILKELDNQDLLKKRDALRIIADLSSLAGMALALFL